MQCFIEIGNHHASLSLLEFFLFRKDVTFSYFFLPRFVFFKMTILRYSKFLSNISLNHLLGAKIQFNPCQTVIVGFLKKIPIHIFLIFGMFYLFILSLIPL